MVNTIGPRKLRAQKWIDNEVLKDSAPYVPFRTGNLMRSGSSGTVIGSGIVKYNAPYAKQVYYGKHMNFSKAKHPQATSMWFEVAKAQKKTAWLSGVAKLMGR